jgi:hypothetical protein
MRFLRVSRLLLWTTWVIYRERHRVVHARACGNYAVRPDSDVLIEVKLADNGPSGRMGFRGRSRGRGTGRWSGLPGFTWLFMFVASLAGGFFLLTDAHQLAAGWFCFGLAGLIALGMLLKS